MNLGDVLHHTAGLVVRMYSFYRFDYVVKTVVTKNLLGTQGKIIQWTVLNGIRLLLAPKMASRAVSTANFVEVQPQPVPQPQQPRQRQQRQRQQMPVVRGITPLPPRR